MITPRQLYQGIGGYLLQPAVLNTLGLDKQALRREMESPQFISEISRIANENDFSCQAVYTLCQPILGELWGETGPTEPLHYIYQFALSFSFPDSVETPIRREWDQGALFYLSVLRVVCQYQKKSRDHTLLSRYPLVFLTQEEEEHYQVSKEYFLFKQAFEEEFLYEMMKLNQEVLGYNTLDHICGVHHLALSLARQLHQLGLPLDLGRVSGAVAGHDLGKFGCRSWEGKRVAYLHYYYTDLWFKRHQIPYIGHIAVNHSTWDLELENLSIESLLLIYADFRVKNQADAKGRMEMTFFTLKDSFEVILNKLDNVDTQKERRYTRVYNKLKDFETYMRHMGVQLDPDGPAEPEVLPHLEYYSLMRGNQIPQHFKYLTIHHNIHLMHQFRDEASLNEILELIRSEKDPRNLREYLDMLEEYSTYLTQKQKMITLRFLYEKLTHPEEDVRKQSAELMGRMIALFDEDYRKEIPEGVLLPPSRINSLSLLQDYLQDFIHPNHKVIPLHRQWMGYSLKLLITSVFHTSDPGQLPDLKELMLNHYRRPHAYETDIHIYLLDVIKHIPLEGDPSGLTVIMEYIATHLRCINQDLRVAALQAMHQLLPAMKKNPLLLDQAGHLVEEYGYERAAAENYLLFKNAKALGWDREKLQPYIKACEIEEAEISNIFLSNLKTATNWVTKKVQVALLLELFLSGRHQNGLYTAMHYCNLLKVSAVESVRNSAGEAVISLFPHLPLEQRNDLSIELLRALEIEGYQFTKYIPNYLGQMLLYLRPYELDEIITDLYDKLKQSNNQIKSLLMRTIGNMVVNYPQYGERFPEDSRVYENRLHRMLGILLNGLVHEDLQIRQISFSVIGKGIFGYPLLSLEGKHRIFQRTAKKILTLLADAEENQLLFLTNSSGLNHLYRFIADYSFHFGPIHLKVPPRICFFPGTFDPFTLGHKEISRAIRDLGFEVYLSVDEFSWSKRTQPHLIRKNIVNMSIADEMDIYLYPEKFPTNIANPDDLRILKENLGEEEIYIVVGSDVVMNASAYQQEPVAHSIHHFPHILFERRESDSFESPYPLEKALQVLEKEMIRLNLPPQYEEISSTQIRNYIDENRDISALIDPMAQKYIYENNLYRREPQYKSVIHTLSLQFESYETPDRALLEKLNRIFHGGAPQTLERMLVLLTKAESRLILLREGSSDLDVLGYTMVHWIPSEQIYQEFKNSQISGMVREQYKGRIVSLDGIFVRHNGDYQQLHHMLLTEILTQCLKNDYGYAIYHNSITLKSEENLVRLLQLHGFVTLPSGEMNPVLAVDMTHPCTVNLDLETIIKEPFSSNEAVKEVIGRTRARLLEALTKLYPGHLVLSFYRSVIDETLVQKICQENQVPPFPVIPRKLGHLMCVPFGNILNQSIVPNTVTKSLHVEKLFKPDMTDFSIGAYPYYLDLANQVKMIRSFDRPIILIDDVLNKGYRMKGLDPLLKEQQVSVHKIIVGILSGRGKELMEIQNREVDCAYFIPKLRLWFNENLLYPFIGGDTLWRGVYPEKNLLSSICLILPYTSPTFIKGVSNRSLYDLSEVSIINAMEILTVLEQEYQRINERKLTLSLLSDVFLFPRYPDAGENMAYDLSLNPSSYLKNDLERLRKLEHTLITGDIRRE